MNAKRYKHPNGYSAKLYGVSSMSIFNAEGLEIMHTGFRKPNTEEEVMELLAEMPDLFNKMLNLKDDIENGSLDDSDEI